MKKQGLKMKYIWFLALFVVIIHGGCKKLIVVDEPINTLTSSEIFSTDATANSAMAGVYSTMINGANADAIVTTFSAGLTTLLAGQSADELSDLSSLGSDQAHVYEQNRLTAINSDRSFNLWRSAYDIIYKANSVIEGVAASQSSLLHDDVRKELTAEAKFIRAFCYFYLTNFFGDVPMALTIDFNQTQYLPRMPQQQVYKQIITDLKDAQVNLLADNSVGKGERIIPNKWAANLMLARVYLYAGDYSNAIIQATQVINNSALFGLEADLKNVFSTTSREAIWQLKQTTQHPTFKNGTPEGFAFSPTINPVIIQYGLTSQLTAAFEPGDQRKKVWTDSVYFPTPLIMTYYPNKYIINNQNANANEPSPQYYMVLRLAEAYLIRAEASTQEAGGIETAITDLNTIRNRAGLSDLDPNLNLQQVKIAIAKERQIEFFAEWGHRWFDLKRTGQAHDVLSVMPSKQPWYGDYQLLYPIPNKEIIADHFLVQNPGY
jgi:hypothetical protein